MNVYAQALIGAVLFGLLYIAVRSALRLIPQRKSVWPAWRSKSDSRSHGLWRLLAAGVGADKLQAHQQLLQGAGLSLSPLHYLGVRRLLLAASVAGAPAGLLLHSLHLVPMRLLVIPSLAVCVGIGLFAGDRWLLDAIGRSRKNRMVGEIYAISRQLLYYSGSALNLHAKLSRCQPQARLLRRPLQSLLHDWYEDPAQAIVRFRDKLGTDEAYSFAETLNALRLHDSEPYYELLRQRAADYKSKMELVRDSRKEAGSYVLFVLAGIPILYTFRVFVHPWVEEGRKLLEGLN